MLRRLMRPAGDYPAGPFAGDSVAWSQLAAVGGFYRGVGGMRLAFTYE